MKFGKVVFTIAGLWGLAVVTPLYFTLDLVGRQSPPPVTHPELYFGFLSVTLVWQIAFLIIATDPARYRPIMVAATLEKFWYVATIGALYLTARLQFSQLAVIVPDFILGLLFVAAFIKAGREARVLPRR